MEYEICDMSIPAERKPELNSREARESIAHLKVSSCSVELGHRKVGEGGGKRSISIFHVSAYNINGKYVTVTTWQTFSWYLDNIQLRLSNQLDNSWIADMLSVSNIIFFILSLYVDFMLNMTKYWTQMRMAGDKNSKK